MKTDGDMSTSVSQRPGCVRSVVRASSSWRRGFVCALIACVASTASTTLTVRPAQAEGYAAFDTQDDNGTGEKPQSKLWYHDGTFWAAIQGNEGVAIYERIGTAWVRSSSMDAILTPAGQSDVKWDGTHLFVLVYSDAPQLFKFSYESDLRIWTLNTGFPVALPRPSGAETMVLDADSTGRLWITAEGGGRIMAYWSTSADHRTWSATGVNLQSGVSSDDISSIVAFGGNRIGVFWSDQNRDLFGFRVHHDGADPMVWDSLETVYTGPGVADDHLNVTADGSGRVYAITKDDFDRMQVHRRGTDGIWTSVQDVIGGIGTRGILMISDADNKAYALYTRWYTASNSPPDPIEYRVADLDNLQFGPSIPFITDTHDVNNVTGTKQILPGGILCAMAGGGGKVWWNGWPATADPSQPPLAPANLAASLQTLPLRTQLAWLAPPSGEVDGYDVYMRVDAGATVKINNELVTGTTFTQMLPPLGGLCYHVVAVRNGLRSPASNTACISHQAVEAPGVPLQVTATPVVPGTTDGALTLWFEGTAGQKVEDLSGHGNDANLGSTTGTDTADPVWITGPAGPAVRLDGINDYLHVSDSGSLDMDGSFTFEAWVQRTNAKRGTIIYKGQASARTISVAITVNGGVEFAWDTRTGVARTLTSPNSTIAPNSGWRHLACTYDADMMQMRIYVDGVLRMTGGASGQPAFNAAALYLGVRPNSGSMKEPFAGGLDGVRLRAGAAYTTNFTPLVDPMALAAGAPTSILIRWQAPASGGAVGSYSADRSTNSMAPVTIHGAPIQRGIFTDENVPAAQLCYRVTALNTHGDPGQPSAPICIDLRTTPPVAPPQNVTVALASTEDRAVITWQAPPSGGAMAYDIYRRVAANSFQLFAQTMAPDTTVTDSTLTGGTWCYLVRSIDSDGAASAASDTACIEFVVPPSTSEPLALAATLVDSTVAGNANGSLVIGFDEGAGQTAADVGGNSNHAVFGANETVESSDPTWVAGLIGSGVRFDGSNDRMRIADSPSLRLNGSFTVEAWVRRASTGTEDCIVSKGDTSKRNFMVMLTADGRVDFTWETTGGGKRGLVSTATIADNNWHHVACVYDQANTRSRIFIDGVLVQSVTDSGTPVGSADPVYLGARTTAGSLKSFFHGTIDLVRVVPSALYADSFTPPTAYRATTSQQMVRLQWEQPASGEAAGYRIYRRQGEGAWASIAPAMVTATHWTDASPLAGPTCYRVTAVDASSMEGPASETACIGLVKGVLDSSPTPEAPVVLTLAATPNPFNPATTLHFALPQASDASLVVYDARGARVVTLVRGHLAAGAHSVRWTGRSDAGTPVASGIYFARLQAGAGVRNAKLLLVK